MFESHNEKLAPVPHYLRRQVKSVLAGCFALLISLGIGVTGYHWIAGLKWIDALLNASMILGGMGPVDPLASDAAKIFASFYALFSGVIFISAMAVILGPAVHRALHKFHLDSARRD
jgi:hypothetical protein